MAIDRQRHDDRRGVPGYLVKRKVGYVRFMSTRLLQMRRSSGEYGGYSGTQQRGIARSRYQSVNKDGVVQHVYFAASILPGDLLQEARVPSMVGMLYWQTKRYRVHNV